MFEFAKILFALSIIIAILMLPKGVKDFHQYRQLKKGDTTDIFKRNLEWEKKIEEAISQAEERVDLKFGVGKYKKDLVRLKESIEKKNDPYINNIILIPRTKADSLRRLKMNK